MENTFKQYNTHKTLIYISVIVGAFLFAIGAVLLTLSTKKQAAVSYPEEVSSSQTTPLPSSRPIQKTATQEAKKTDTVSAISQLLVSMTNGITEPNKAPTVASSKLGIFLIDTYSEGAKKIIAAKPRIIRVLDPQANTSLLEATKAYKNTISGGIVVLSMYNNIKKYSLANDPEQSASDYYETVIKPVLDKLGNDKHIFTYIEAPNETNSTPDWNTKEQAAWLNTFWSKTIELNAQSGMRTCIGSIPVGNPPGDTGAIKEKLQEFLPALKKAYATAGALCYHAYTYQYTTDETQEQYTSLRYRLLHSLIVELEPTLVNLPMILSEAGIDREGNPETSGYLARVSNEEYEKWLQWFDTQIQRDNYVLGATLFQIGATDWKSFNIEQISGWLAEHITAR